MKIDLSKLQKSAALNGAPHRSGLVLLLCSVLFVNLLACGTPPQPDAHEAGTTAQALVETRLAETAAAATATPTITPSPTNTPTPTLTPTLTPTATPTLTPTPVGGGGAILFQSQPVSHIFNEEVGSSLRVYNFATDSYMDLLMAGLPNLSYDGSTLGLLVSEEQRYVELDLRTGDVLNETNLYRLAGVGDYAFVSQAISLADGAVLFRMRCQETKWVITSSSPGGPFEFSPVDLPDCPTFWKLSPDRTDLEPVNLSNGLVANASLSPDGRSLAYAANGTSTAYFDLYVVDIESREVTQLTDSPLNENTPVWTPDGESIAYSVEGDTYLLDLASGEASLFKEGAEIPAWSPDGGSLVYMSGGRLYLETDKNEPQPLTAGTTFAVNPVWLPAPYEGPGEPAAVAEELTQTESEVHETVMRTTLSQLAELEYIPHSEGTFTLLPDLERTWAQMGWFEWTTIGSTYQNFVLSARVSWESASETPDWNLSGCGVIFRENGPSNYYAIFNTLDGKTAFSRMVNGTPAYLVSNKPGFSSFDQTGQGSILLVAYDHFFYFFVNGFESFDRTDQGISEGALGMALLSGTNQGFGTRCTWTDIEVFELDP